MTTSDFVDLLTTSVTFTTNISSLSIKSTLRTWKVGLPYAFCVDHALPNATTTATHVLFILCVGGYDFFVLQPHAARPAPLEWCLRRPITSRLEA